jgi:hypothetical protein
MTWLSSYLVIPMGEIDICLSGFDAIDINGKQAIDFKVYDVSPSSI